jgi:putative redox protein
MAELIKYVTFSEFMHLNVANRKRIMLYFRSAGNKKMSDSLTEITATWKGENTFIGQTEAGGTVQMGSLAGKPGVGPMHLLLTAVAGCTGMDIVSILQKKRYDLTDMQVQVSGKRATDYPMIWTEIHITYLIWGDGLTPKDVEQAIELSETKYCSVGIMLGKSAKITSEYKIFKPGESER